MPDIKRKEKQEPEQKTRYQLLRETGSPLVELPEPGDKAYLVEFLMEIGPAGSGFSGPVPISWAEINAWREATGTILTGQELVTLRELSKAYVAQYYDSTDRNCPAPYVDTRGIDQTQLADRIAHVLRSIPKRGKRG